MDPQQTALVICGAAVIYVWYRRHRNSSIRDVPGPKNPSWIYGHRLLWQSKEAGVIEKNLLEEYGTVVRWNGALGEERLWIADPKAIHRILQGSGYLYEKPPITMELATLIADRGIISAEGDAHKRQRRAMTPAFGLVEAKGLYPYFTRCSNSLVDKWQEIISNSESENAAIINVYSWFSRAALDAIGAGAFDYDFGALENSDNKLTKSYKDLTFNTFGTISKGRLLMMDLLKWTPEGTATWLFERGKGPGATKLRENKMYAHEVAAQLIEEKRQELRDGTSRKDVLSLLVKANSALRPDWRLNDEEVVAQVRTIMLAGHETTAKVLTFTLWELAKNRHVQEKLREEIVETLEQIRTRGDDEFTADDFDSMPYLLAVGKEILRVYPIVTELQRVPKKDDVLPLSKPVVGVSGKVYKELLVPAGTTIMVSQMGYNVNKDLWGPDAHEFLPERWLNMTEKPESSVGVYANLLSFSGGHKSCIGWRFAVIELHTFLVTLIKQFDFSLPGNGQEIKMIKVGVVTPLVVGEEEKGPQLPLTVTVLRNE